MEDEILKDMRDAADSEEKPKKRWFSPAIAAPLMIFLLVLMVIPYYGVRLSPEPRNIPTLNSLTGGDFVMTNTSVPRNQILLQVNPNDPVVKQIASRIAVQSCPSGARLCQAKAIYYFVRDNIKYVGDPPDEYVESPAEVLYVGGADCDGHAVLLGSMLEAIGVHSRYVFMPGHVYNSAYLPDAKKSIRGDDDYVELDATCKTCDFGELPPFQAEKTLRVVG